MLDLSGLLGLVIFVLDVWAIFQVVQSQADNLHKAMWIGLIFFLPLLGFVVWLVWGPSPQR
jgi:hypothetical protein